MTPNKTLIPAVKNIFIPIGYLFKKKVF